MRNQPRIPQLSGRVYLLIAILIFGAANAITRKLTEIGAQNLINGRNPISFCNVLFVGNLCALIILAILHQSEWRISLLKRITSMQWLKLSLIAFLSSVAVPTLIFTALSLTRVNNVVLIGQIDTPLVLALSILLLRERVNNWVIAGAVVSFIGVTLTVLLQAPTEGTVSTGMGISIGLGELLTLIAAFLKAVSNLISKVTLQTIPLGIFNVFRMTVGTIIFFIATIVFYGPNHFMDITSKFLWQWMLLYSAVIVVGGQLAWFSGLKRSSASEISLATAFNPIAGILAAYLILGEVPTVAQYIGGAVIICGIALNQVGVKRLSNASKKQVSSEQMSEEVTFKGV